MPIIPLVITAVKFIAPVALFWLVDKLLPAKEEEMDGIINAELPATLAIAGGLTIGQTQNIARAAGTVPGMEAIKTPNDAANFIEGIQNSKGGKAEFAKLNATQQKKAFSEIGKLKKALRTSGASRFPMGKLFWLALGVAVWFPFIIQQLMDQGVFQPWQANRVMDAMGVPKKFRWPTPIQPGPLKIHEFEVVLDVLEIKEPFGIENPVRKTTMLWSADNFLLLINDLWGEHLLKGEKITNRDLINEAQRFVRTKKEPTEEDPTELKPKVIIPPPINIAGITFGQITVAPFIVEKITNLEELKGAIRQLVQGFLNQISDRLSFNIRLVKVWIAPGGRIITPSPPSYVERSTTATGVSMKIRQNKIVLLEVFFTTHENKRTKIFAIPLDYSVADNVITPPADEPTGPLPLIVDIVKLTVAQPPAAVPLPPSEVGPSPLPAVPPLVEAPKAPLAPPPPPTVAPPVVPPPPPPTPPPTMQIPPEGTNPQTISPRLVEVSVATVLVRSGPSTEYALSGSQRLSRGQKFTVVGWTRGENVEGEDRWWKSQFNNWVWTGGTKEKP